MEFPEFIKPVAFEFWIIKVHWYGIMYLLGFAVAWWLGVRRTALAHSPVRKAQIEDILFYCVIGVVVGGRLGHVFFYSFDDWLKDPLWPIKVWEGGMSFHGGILGVCAAMWLYARNNKIPFLSLMDFVTPSVPIALGLGRIGNFIGQELWGRVTTLSWGMHFPKASDPAGVLRHPSQLYEAMLEGFLMFIVIYWFARKPRPMGAVCSLFVFLYGCARFGVEFTREPDQGVALLFGWLSRGQLLSTPMILIGLGVFIWSYSKGSKRRGRF
jgi:phosphatidylglycerol:prolipoprotein diacylglycerol transferase